MEKITNFFDGYEKFYPNETTNESNDDKFFNCDDDTNAKDGNYKSLEERLTALENENKALKNELNEVRNNDSETIERDSSNLEKDE